MALNTTGQGVLIKLTGADAKELVTKYITEYGAKAYQITDADQGLVDGYFQAKFNASKKIPTMGKYAGDVRARVIDEYDLYDNNCTTISVLGVMSGGSQVFKEFYEKSEKKNAEEYNKLSDEEKRQSEEISDDPVWKETDDERFNIPDSPSSLYKFLQTVKNVYKSGVIDATDKLLQQAKPKPKKAAA